MKESQLHYQDCGSVEVCINSQCPEKHKCRPKRRTCLDLRYFYIGLGGVVSKRRTCLDLRYFYIGLGGGGGWGLLNLTFPTSSLPSGT